MCEKQGKIRYKVKLMSFLDKMTDDCSQMRKSILD